MTGPTGQTGEAGLAQGGIRGPTGAAGGAGEQGPRGAQGAQGGWTTGPTGQTGATGATGSQGRAGETGARGESAAGYAGAAGDAGLRGPRGETGETGPRGPSMPGAAGAAGSTGATGEQGAQGAIGARGATTAGVAGATGPDGPSGPQGPKGETGPRGLRADGSIDPSSGMARTDERSGSTWYNDSSDSRAASQSGWTNYRDFRFSGSRTELNEGDTGRFEEISRMMRDNPTHRLAIDGTPNRGASNTGARDLSEQRVESVRRALVNAGVASDRISIGSYGDPNSYRDGRVEVLLNSDRLSSSERATTNWQRDNEATNWQRDNEASNWQRDNEASNWQRDNEATDWQRDRADTNTQRDRADTNTQRDRDDANWQRDSAAGRTEARGQDQAQSDRTRALTNEGGQWTAFRSFWFEPSSSTLAEPNSVQIQEVASHMKANPNSRIGLDGTMTPNAGDSSRRNQDLSERRIMAVREALITAGVPGDRIDSGGNGSEDWRQRGRVDLLMVMPQSQRTSTNTGAMDRPSTESECRGLWFDTEKVSLTSADAPTIKEIAAYMKENPTARVGIDASPGAGETGERAADLKSQRISTVREQLVEAGVPADRIDADVYADRRSRQEGRVTVLVQSDDRAASR